jgi:hypothetical protein
MLSDEDRMSLERRLLAVVRWACRGQALREEVGSFCEYGLQTLNFEVSQFRPTEPETPAKRRFGQVQEKLVDVLRGLPPSEQGKGRCADHDLILPKRVLKVKPVASPPGDVQRFGHDFEYDDLVMHRPAAFRGGSLGGRAGKGGQSAELLCQMLSDFRVFFGLERLTAIVMEGQKYLDCITPPVLLNVVLAKRATLSPPKCPLLTTEIVKRSGESAQQKSSL